VDNSEGEATDGREWEFELEIPSQYAALGTLVAAFLPHLPLLHASIVLLQLGRLPFQRWDEDDDEDEG
jgi:hypothetical protein